MINEIDINEKVVSYKLPFGKQGFKYFIDYKDDKKLDLHAYSFREWGYIEVLTKVIICVLW